MLLQLSLFDFGEFVRAQLSKHAMHYSCLATLYHESRSQLCNEWTNHNHWHERDQRSIPVRCHVTGEMWAISMIGIPYCRVVKVGSKVADIH